MGFRCLRSYFQVLEKTVSSFPFVARFYRTLLHCDRSTYILEFCLLNHFEKSVSVALTSVQGSFPFYIDGTHPNPADKQ